MSSRLGRSRSRSRPRPRERGTRARCAGELRDEDLAEERFWVLVDIGRDPEIPPSYWIVPEWWMLNHIHVRYHERIAVHGGKRLKNPDSTHFAIVPKNVEQWRHRWELLGIF